MTKPTKTNAKKELDLRQLAMIKALEKCLGIVTTACKEVGIDRCTHYEWLKNNKTYRKAAKDIENIALDFAESCLHKQIQKGNPLSTMFYLKCKAKGRGYIEQNIVEFKGNMKFKADFGISNTIHPPSEAEGDTSFDK
jgi:hypothetical protein